MALQKLATISFDADYEDAPPGAGSPGSMAPGSRNILSLAQKNKKVFRGLTSVGKGSRVMFPLKTSYGGLSDYVSGSTRTVGSITINLNTLTDAGNPFVIGDDGKAIQLKTAGPGGLDLIGYFKYVGAGSGTIWVDSGFITALNASATFTGNLTYVYGTKIQGGGAAFSGVANTIFYQGAGQLTVTGTDITGATASSTLKLLLQRAGSYTAGDSGPYSAGLNQPSAPLVDVPATPGAGFTGLFDGVFSFKIAALRSTTGARSIASPMSAVAICAKQTVKLTIPAAQAGQDYWVFFGTFKGFGGVGVAYRMPISGVLQISEATVAAATGRQIEIEYQDGDLTTEAAWIDDYPPPAGTHPFGLNNIVGVGGCYSDATSGPSTTSPGTCVALSLPNFPESFRPTDLLYLPEQIMGLLGRPTDSYIYVGCRNSVHQIQYVGGTSGPAAVLTTLWPDVGIANPHGWCQVYGIIFAAVSRGGLVTIGALGQPDSTFSAPVREYTRNWDPASTIVNWHPDTQQVVFSNGTQSVAYCLQTGGWSTPIYLPDFATGNALSAVQTGDQMRLTLDRNGTHTLYSYNVGSGCTFAAFSQWFEAPIDGRTKTIWEVAERAQVDNVANSIYVSLHRNHRTPSDTTAIMTSGSNQLDVSTANFFIAGDLGSFVLVPGAGAAGAPLLARIGTVNSGTRVHLVDATTIPIGSAAVQNAGTSVSGAFMVIGQRIYARTPNRVGHNIFQPKRRRMREAWAYSIGMIGVSNTTTGDAQMRGATLFGSVDGGSQGIST